MAQSVMAVVGGCRKPVLGVCPGTTRLQRPPQGEERREHAARNRLHLSWSFTSTETPRLIWHGNRLQRSFV